MELALFFKRLPVVWLWLVLVFLASGLIINVIQLLLLPLWFINKDLFRWLNLNVVYLHWCRKYKLCSNNYILGRQNGQSFAVTLAVCVVTLNSYTGINSCLCHL